MIRHLRADDLGELAELRIRGSASTADQQRAQAAMTRLFPELYFRSPSYDAGLSGLVSEGTDGRLNGMIAVGARPMLLQGQPISAAIGADLFVAEESRRSMAGLALMKGLLNGPQDLTISDIANQKTRQLWERLGGFVATAWNINWIGVLRPGQLAAGMLQECRGGRLPGSILRAVSPIIDRLAPQRLKCEVIPVRGGFVESTLTPEEFSQHLHELTEEESVQPVFSRESAEWMWKRLPYLSPEAGELSAVMVRNSRGRLLGWYLYNLENGGVARVVQIAARTADADAVISHLFARTWEQGAAAVAGRAQPRFLQSLIDRGCLLRARESFTLIHSGNPQIADAFRSGRAWLSVLDGEAPLNVWNRPEQAAGDLAPLSSGIRPFGIVQSSGT